MAKTINILPAVQVNASAVTVDVEITENGYTRTDQYAFNANDFDCNCSSSNPYVAKFLFDPGDITMILEVQGDFTTVKFDGVTKASAYALAQDVIADIDQYASSGGGGSYTFPANHGNVAYVAVDGNDGTGAVGNISKPFETLQAGIDALDSGSAGQVIILSSGSFGQDITDLDSFTTHPYVLSIINYTDTPIAFTGTGDRNAGQLTIQTPGIVQFNITGGGTFNVDDIFNIDCRSFYIPGTHNCDIVHTGVIKCNIITIDANTNNPSIDLGNVLWTVGCNILEPLNSYVYIKPKRYRAILAQSGTSAPTATVLENSLNLSTTYSRVSDGINRLVNGSAVFTANKTIVRFNPMKAASIGVSAPSIVSTTQIDLVTYDEFAGLADGNLDGAELLIEVYP